MLNECVAVWWSWHLPSRTRGIIAHCASAALPQSNTASVSEVNVVGTGKHVEEPFTAANEP